MNDWIVKLPGRLRPTIEKIAAEEFLPAPELVRQMLQRAVFEKQVAQVKQRQTKEPA